MIENAVTTFGLNKILSLIEELLQESNALRVGLMTYITSVSSDSTPVHVMALALRENCKLIDKNTVEILFRMCGLESNGFFKTELQKTIFEAIFLDDKSV